MTTKPDTTAKGVLDAIARKTDKASTSPRVVKPVPAPRIKLLQYTANSWSVTCPDDLHVADFELPGLWTFAEHFRRGDLVHCLQTHRWTQCIVADSGPAFAQLVVIATVELPEQRNEGALALPPGYSVRRSVAEDNALGKYSVVRDIDGFLMNTNERHDSFEVARAWLLAHNAVRVGSKTNRPI
jgi:hypothetical protein